MTNQLALLFALLALNLFALCASLVTKVSIGHQAKAMRLWAQGFTFYLLFAAYALAYVCFIGWEDYQARGRAGADALQALGCYFQYLGFAEHFNRRNRKHETLMLFLAILVQATASVLLLLGFPNALYRGLDYLNLSAFAVAAIVVITRSIRLEHRNDRYVLSLIVFVALYGLINTIDRTWVFFFGKATSITLPLAYINPFFGLLIVTILAFAENQLVNARVRTQLLGTVGELRKTRDRLRESQRELLETNADIVNIVSESLELRLYETSNHVRRVSKFTRVLLSKLNNRGYNPELIANAAALHDIGKIGVPDEILAKATAFTKEEREIIKTHTRMGFEILSGSNQPFLGLAAGIALEHHENWDGSGYPEGKSGTAIGFPSRVVAVADTFDALINARAYKQAWSFEESVAYILSNSGIRFDPEVAQVLPECLIEFKRILEEEKPKQGKLSQVPSAAFSL
jgi:HD-GYP domain-containing protein (c-di-GMP phosphodiesterase class II)